VAKPPMPRYLDLPFYREVEYGPVGIERQILIVLDIWRLEPRFGLTD